MRNLINVIEAMTRDGNQIELRYVERQDNLKPGCYCDAVLAFIDGEQVGYVKFDYTTLDGIAKDLPTLWGYAGEYSGFALGDAALKPYGEMTVADMAKMLKSIKQYSRVSSNTFKKIGQHAADVYDHFGGFDPIAPEEGDREDFLSMLKQMEKTPFGKKIAENRAKYIRHHVKPFVAYINTGMNSSNGNNTENKQRGIGGVLYRAAAQWIAHRGLGKGLYASTNQSDEATAVWNSFVSRGWVTVDEDDNRRYLDPTKFDPID